MKNTLTLLLIFVALLLHGQSIEGGGGVCHVSGDPNDVAALEAQDVRAECFLVVDTTSGTLYVYDPTGTVGSRWVEFSGGGGNGIISALPAGDVNIDADGNDFQIGKGRMIQLQSRSMATGITGASNYDTATVFGRIYESGGYNTPANAWFDGLKAGRLHAGIDPWTPNYRVGTWGSFNAGDYAYSGFRWEIDSSVYRIRVYAEGNSSDDFPGLEYDADYSADFVTRSLVDKGYVDSRPDLNGLISELPGDDVSIAAAGNDLNISGLGDYLIETDNYSVGSHPDFLNPGFPEFIGLRVFGEYGSGWFENDSVYSVGLRPSFGSGLHRAFYFDPTGSNIQVVNFGTGSTNFQGLIYSTDFSADFVDRSLVDKAYVDGVVGGGGDPILIDDETLHTTTQTALAGEVVLIDCSSGAVTVNPPASPVKNMTFYVSDAVKSAGTNTITIDFTTASQPLCGGVENYLIENDGGFAGFKYVNGTTGWIPLNR